MTNVAHRYLRCAVLVMLAADNAKDAETKAKLNNSLGYFLGHFEGETGLEFEDELTPEFSEEVALNAAKYKTQCDNEVRLYAERMHDWDYVSREVAKAPAK